MRRRRPWRIRIAAKGTLTKGRKESFVRGGDEETQTAEGYRIRLTGKKIWVGGWGDSFIECLKGNWEFGEGEG